MNKPIKNKRKIKRSRHCSKNSKSIKINKSLIIKPPIRPKNYSIKCKSTLNKTSKSLLNINKSFIRRRHLDNVSLYSKTQCNIEAKCRSGLVLWAVIRLKPVVKKPSFSSKNPRNLNPVMCIKRMSEVSAAMRIKYSDLNNLGKSRIKCPLNPSKKM